MDSKDSKGNTTDFSKRSQKDQLDYMKNVAKYYEEKGENQLVKDIFANVITQKANGTLTNEQILTFVKKVSPMLNKDQRDRLNGLVEKLIET